MPAIVIASASTKGGTGKTSLAKFYGITKVQEGKRVLIIDLCQNSDVATRLGYDRTSFKYDAYDWASGEVTFKNALQHDEETGIDFIPGSNNVPKIRELAEKKRVIKQEWFLEDLIEPIRAYYDYIIIDTHPTESDRMLVMSLIASSLALLPTIMDKSSVVATARTIEIITDLINSGIELDYQIVPMAVDFSRGFKKELDGFYAAFQEVDINQFTPPIRYSSVINRASMNDQVVDLSNKYMKKVLGDYQELSAYLDTIAKPKKISTASFE
ncbi:ParA family protein [Priestia megaterium]|uniref:ParA family protein n=1 Tax=Priestia megaterium TaxID=1404 RepID=UPI003CFD2F56